MNLRERALAQGVHPKTAYRWFREERLPVPARRVGRLILVEAADPVASGRVVAGATELGLTVGQVVSEVGSGINGHRRKLTRVLSDPAATVIVVEHRDRLTRFGFEHLQASLASAGRRIVVLDNADTADDVVADVTEVLTSLCARRYGRASASRRAAKAVLVATGDEPR